MTFRRVVVTGIGTVTGLGTGADQFWEALSAGRSGVGRIEHIDTSGLPVAIGSEVRDFDPYEHMEPRIARRVERFGHFAVVATNDAFQNAGLTREDIDGDRTGVIIGTCYAGMSRLERESVVLRDRGWKAVPPEISMSMMPTAAAGVVSIVHGLRGPIECIDTVCASGAQSISRGFDLIRLGIADTVVAGGADAPLSPMALATFANARALSKYSGDPTRASRPFDADRDGLVFGEGATVLILEEEAAARARDASILAEILGWGHSGDAHNLAQPDPQGAGQALAMRAALRMADCVPADVGYINAHATATPTGDISEARAINAVWDAKPPPVSSTKSMHGHMMGATGSTEAAAAVLALVNGLMPPTINYETPDPNCDLDVVPNVARAANLDVVVTNSFGMGGINCSLVFGRA